MNQVRFSLLYSPDMYQGLVTISQWLENVQVTSFAIEPCRAYVMHLLAGLDTEQALINTEQALINTESGVRLGFVGLHITPGDRC